MPDDSMNHSAKRSMMINSLSSSTAALPSASDIEITLGQVEGVFASRVVLGQDAKISEIHIVTSTSRKPKPIIRDIETLVYVKHGVRVDYRKISLVQLSDEQLLRIPLARAIIRKVTEEDLGDQKRIRVEIRGGGKIVVGEALEKIDNPSPFQSAAKATINAIEKLLGQSIDVQLENVTTLRLDTREVILVILTCFIENREETFVGAGFVDGRPVESAARATMDALNRRIYTLTVQAPHRSRPDV